MSRHCIFDEPNFSRQRLDELIAQKLINCRKHPSKDLWIYSYSKICVVNQAWEPWTLAARGLILDADGGVVARPFSKFFNHDERPGKAIVTSGLGPEHVFEKMDGSLGILFFDGDWTTGEITTKGSFESAQGAVGNRLYQGLSDDVKRLLRTSSNGYTHMFEIICPESKVVVDYGKESFLTYIGACCKASGNQFPPTSSHDWVKLPKNYAHQSIEEMMANQEKNAEGFVCWYLDASGDYNLVKVKFDEYVQLHRLVTQYSADVVLQQLKKDFSWEPDPELPNHEEASKDLEAMLCDLGTHLDFVWQKVFNFIESGKRKLSDKRSFSTFVQREFCQPEHSAMAFLMFDHWDDEPNTVVMNYIVQKVLNRKIKFGKYLGWPI